MGPVYYHNKFQNNPTSHYKDIGQKPFPVHKRTRKTYRVRSAYRPLAILLHNIMAKSIIYHVYKFGDVLPSGFWDIAQNSFGDLDPL